MTESDLISSDQVAGYPHPKVTKTLFGHDAKEKEFLRCFESGKLHHSWLITGTRGVGKATLAWRIAKFILTQPLGEMNPKDIGKNTLQENLDKTEVTINKSDYAKIIAESDPRISVVRRGFDEKRKAFRSNIVVDDIRRLKSFFSMSVSDGGHRVVIIDCADDMNVNAANALLKILEEPPKNSLFLIICHNPQFLLSTITSRCRELRLADLEEQDLMNALAQIELSFPTTDNEIYSLLGSGSVGNTIKLIEHDGATMYRTILSFLEQMPNLNGHELVNFIETLSGTKNRSRLELVVDLLNTAIARLSKAGVLGPYSSDRFIKIEKEIFQKLCPTPIMASRWADLVQVQSKNLNHGLSVNLDPGSLILDTFFRIQDCAEAVR